MSSPALSPPDATYVSLNTENPELAKIMPWVGTSLLVEPEDPLGIHVRHSRLVSPGANGTVRMNWTAFSVNSKG